MGVEVTTVADDLVVVHADGVERRYEGLAPATTHRLDGLEVTTLPSPGGERIGTIATVNDVHLGERVCGKFGPDGGPGPLFRSAEGATPYPELMAEAAAAEIARAEPDLVIAKGDLTGAGRAEDFAAFDRIFDRFGARLRWTLGNHDTSGEREAPGDQLDVIAGVTVAVTETARPGREGGTLDAGQLELLDATCAGAAGPVMAFGHHPVDGPWLGRPDGEPSFLLDPDASAALGELADRREGFVGWFAGHTHRHLVRPLGERGRAVSVEVGTTKDFPGVWAEYRIFEGGILQVVHRISDPAALAWSEPTRAMFGGLYESFALGRLEDRCLVLPASVPATPGSSSSAA